MINSVNDHSSNIIKWHILALTSKCANNLKNLNLESTTIYSIQDIQSVDMKNLSQSRSWPEFCFASGPIFLSFLSSTLNDGEILGYVDSDCYFYNDINLGLDKFDTDIEIQIHEHRFSNDRIHWVQKSGQFNVGLVIGLIGKTYNSCLFRWQEQVIKDSSIDEIRGTCGDQKYLDEWPSLYKSLKIMKSHGMGVAPWNLNSTYIHKKDNNYFANDDLLVFFHFHGLEIYYFKNKVGLWADAPGYNLINNFHLPIYLEYLNSLNYYAELYRDFFQIRKRKLNLSRLLRLIRNRNVKFTFFKST